MPAPRIRPIAAAVVTLALTLSICAPAFGSTISDKQAQAAAVQKQIAALDTKAEIASEAYNVAHDRLGKLTAQVGSTERRIGVLGSRMKRLQVALDGRAVRLYREGPLGFLAVLLNVRTFDDFDTAIQLLTNVSVQDANTVSQLKTTKHDAEVARASLKAAQKAAARQQTTMAANANAVRVELAARQKALAGISADIKQLIAQQQAAQAACAAFCCARYAR